jgi:hypothetical protein
MDAKSLVVNVHGRSEVTWEADIAGVTEVESGAFSFEGWLFALIVEKSSKAPERWSVYLSECLRPSASVGKEWKLKQVRADYELSCPDHGWASVFSISDERMNLASGGYGAPEVARVEEGTTKLKVRLVMTKLEARLKHRG